jgi:phage tail-like protein
MAIFSVNAQRIDPYKNFKFVVKFDGKTPVAALQKCSGLKKTTEIIEWREAGNSSVIRKMPGRTNYGSVTMEAGVTHDLAFEDWANLVNTYTGATDAKGQMSLAKFRKDIRIEILNEQGTAVIAYNVFRAWVSEYTAHADLDSNGKAVLITNIKIEHEGYQRDLGVKEPKEA